MSRPTRWLLAVLAVNVLIGWTVAELLGSTGLSGSGGVLGVTAVLWWKNFGSPAKRRDADLTSRALQDHRDPGPQHRAAVDARAEQLLAAPRSDELLPAVLLLGLALACGVLALVRGEVAVALPALPLAVVAVVFTVWARRRLLAASRWLDDPPYEQEQP